MRLLSQHIFIEHLARSVLFSRYRSSVPVAMFSAYFDESGDSGKPVMSVAGFVSTVKKWGRFEGEWKAILKSEGMTEFHMTDWVSDPAWKGQSERRRKFMTRLVECLKKNSNKAFHTALSITDYNFVNKRMYLQEIVGRPYAVCAMQCQLRVEKWAARKGIRSPVLCFFEDGARDRGDFQLWAKRVKWEPIPLSKKIGIPLQGADIYAWKIRIATAEALQPDLSPERILSILRSLSGLHSIPHEGGILNRDSLLTFCRRRGIPTRPVTASTT